jgi:hypothetical protein
MKHIDINKIRKGFFKKSLSVGHHNIKYTWVQVMTMILNCVCGRESFENGAKSPSAQTLRDRLQLDGKWLEYFHEQMWGLAQYIVKRFSRMKWYISIDEKYQPFFGDREKLNKRLRKEGKGEFVHGYRAKTPGATGSFCFLVISLSCCKFRLPLFVKMMKNKESYKKWTEEKLRRILRLVPQAIVLADRGFGKRAWFFAILEKLNAKYDVRVPLKKKESKNKVKSGVKNYQQWFGEGKNKVLLYVDVVKDEYNRTYLLANNLQDKTPLQILSIYRNRWDIENLFKDSDRVGLPTSSTNPKMKLFSFVLSLILFALWQIEKVTENIGNSLRGFVKECVHLLSLSLNFIINSIGEIIENVILPNPP